MLKHDLGYHPDKLQIVPEFKETDLSDGKIFVNNFCYLPTGRHGPFFSDKPHFKLNGCVNKQIMRYWLADNPNWYITKSLHLNGLQCGAPFHSIASSDIFFQEQKWMYGWC